MAKYLTLSGLTTFLNKLKSYVATTSRNGLMSTNDKKKLDGVNLTMPLTRGTFNDNFAKMRFIQVFAGGYDGVKCLAAHVLDIDTANCVATIRYTIGMENTDAQSFLVKMNGQVIAGGAGNEEKGIGAVVVTVPFTITTGAVSMWNKYSIEWI